MQHIPSTTKEKRPLSRWWFLLWGFLAGLLVVTLIGLVLLLARGTMRSLASGDTPNPVPDARVELMVAADGCGVERSEVTGKDPVMNLTWVVKDEDGYSVLERIAEGETKYRYFVSGHYFVSVKAWYNGNYHLISNEVEIDC